VHELSVCQALLKQVTDIAMNRGASAVQRIAIEVGPLCGVEPALLARAFEALRVGSCAAQAVLSIESPAVSIRCLSCDAQSCVSRIDWYAAHAGIFERESWRGTNCDCVASSCAFRSHSPLQFTDSTQREKSMCQTCGCSLNVQGADSTLGHEPGSSVVIDVLQNLLAANDRLAAHNREHFDEHGVLAINLMSSPGAGKTALLEATIMALRSRYRIAVIEGDLETDNDAVRIRAHGVPAVQITTGTACHLDAQLVHRALHELPLAGLDLLFIENVGNLVCPASFDLGQHRNVTLLSVTEGDDKPAKYPVMFRASDLVVLSKADLLDVLDDFDPLRAAAALRRLGRDTPMICTAARRMPQLQPWLDWLEEQLHARQPVASGLSVQMAASSGF
jgi:hydrogenase nickel incorporation protein HypB